MTRRQVSKKLPSTISFNQSRKAENEKSSEIRDVRSAGIAKGATVAWGRAEVVLVTSTTVELSKGTNPPKICWK